MFLKKIKVLLFISQLTGGGAERFTANLANSLDKKRFEAVVVSLAPFKSYPLNENVKLVKLYGFLQHYFYSAIWHFCKFVFSFLAFRKKNLSNKSSLKNYFFYTQVLKKFKQTIILEKPDIVFSCLQDFNELVVDSSNVVNCKVFLSERSFPGLSEPFDFSLLKSLYSKADVIIANSIEIKHFLLKTFPKFREKFVAIHNPVDFDRVLLLGKEKLEHKFFNHGIPIVVSCGRLDWGKGFDVLLESFVLVREKIDCRLVVLGDGVLHNDLIALRDELGLKDCVDFVGWQDNPFKFFSNADLFVLSSRFEGFPNVLLEAMCFGLPAISTDCSSGPKETITNGIDGLLVPVDDVGGLANAMLKVLKNEKLRKELGKNAVGRAKEFDSKKVAKKFEKMFISINNSNSEGQNFLDNINRPSQTAKDQKISRN